MVGKGLLIDFRMVVVLIWLFVRLIIFMCGFFVSSWKVLVVCFCLVESFRLVRVLFFLSLVRIGFSVLSLVIFLFWLGCGFLIELWSFLICEFMILRFVISKFFVNDFKFFLGLMLL